MSAATAVTFRDLTEGVDALTIDTSDMPSGDLTVQHILDQAGVSSAKNSVLVDGTKVTDLSTVVTPGSEILMIPNVANG